MLTHQLFTITRKVTFTMDKMKTEDFLRLITTIHLEYPGSFLTSIGSSSIVNRGQSTLYCYDLWFLVNDKGTDKMLEVTVNKKTGAMVDSKFIEDSRIR